MILPLPRVLYVDDHQDSWEMMTILIQSEIEDVEITTVSSAEEALTLISEQSFDLYLLDFSLPDMSGVELCRQIRLIDDSKARFIFYGACAGIRSK